MGRALRRVFAEDVLPCACGGRRTVVAFVADANLTRSLLTSLGLPAERLFDRADARWMQPRGDLTSQPSHASTRGACVVSKSWDFLYNRL
jgi:hypothetical protein